MTDQRHPLQRRIERARRLRKNATTPERILWGQLRGGRLLGLKFRRQHPIGPYIVDYYCHEARLVVELDGMSHVGQGARDAERTRFLESQGVHVVRYTNDDVLNDVVVVAEAVALAAGKSWRRSPSPPAPLPGGEGG